MQLSPETQLILNNFAEINTALIIRANQPIQSFAMSEKILGIAKVKESFPKDIGILNLANFLSVIKLHQKKGPTELEFEDKFILVKNAGAGKQLQTEYTYGNISAITSEPPGKMQLKTVDVTFLLTAENIEWMQAIGSLLSVPNFVFESVKGFIRISACDGGTAPRKSDKSFIELDEYTGPEFKFVISLENLKIIPGNYLVELSKQGLSRFTHQTIDIHYYIAIEKKSSKFG